MKAKIHIPAVTSGCKLKLVSLAVSPYFGFFPTQGVLPGKDQTFCIILSSRCIWGITS